MRYITPILTMFFFGAVLWIADSGCSKDDAQGYRPGSPIVIDSFTPTEGSGATEVLISGANFTSDTSQLLVTINGKPLKIVGASDNQIMAVVPKKVGSGPIDIQIGDNKATSAKEFTYFYTRTVTTLAGNGQPGFSNGKGTDAQFHFSDPANSWFRSMGITVDDQLNIYVADPGNHCIRKIDTAGNVSTLAGNPNISGYADGKGAAANFVYPYDVTTDAAGNVYAVDPINWDIRKISPDGTAITLGFGAADPWSVAIDPTDGSVFYGSNSSGGIYRLSGGNSTAVVTGLSGPGGIVFDPTGNLYVVASGEQVIRKYANGSWNGKVIAGTEWVPGFSNGTGTAASFANPWGIAIDEQLNLYVAGNGSVSGDPANADQSIRQISASDWEVSTFAGSGTAGYNDAIGGSASFSAPTGVAVDKNGVVYVLDKNNNCVRKIVSE